MNDSTRALSALIDAQPSWVLPHIDPGLPRLARLFSFGDLGELPDHDRAALQRALARGERRAVRERLFALDPTRMPDERLEELPASWWFNPAQAHVVVTGFQPFGPHPDNPSAHTSLALANALSQTFRVHHDVLPVTFELASVFAGAQLTERGPTLFVQLGYDAAGETLRLERTAHNWRVGASEGRSAASDERNASDPRSEEVAPGRLSVTGPPALAGDFPFAELQRALNRQRDARQATTLSDDCGSYVCNALYYHSLAAVRERRHRGEFADALFVHVPKIEPTAARELGYRLADTLIEQLERMEP